MSEDVSKYPINILFFASIIQRTGESKITLSLPEELTIKDLKEILKERYPAIGSSFHTALFAVNKEFAFDDDRIPTGAEVAIFPPVSGGSVKFDLNDNQMPTLCRLTDEEIDFNALLSEITND